MFTSLGRFRRQIAVLTALSLLATVLVAVPAVAADPKADYTATFDACSDAPSSGFSDVPMGHANYGDINCIAYYGITRGTSATTYSPLMSVTREHMALFLTRLAGLVGITVESKPSNAGFTDIGELSAESQTAINQLYALGVTKVTSMSTYSPDDNVKRGHMALFIQRLMNKMAPLADGDRSLDDTKFYGYTPALVEKNEKVKVKNQDGEQVKPAIESPFTDLGSASKNQHDAVTQLYELGVASGISDTAYAPGSDITRAAMAGFMAAVLDHSNARPAGISIQADKTFGFGEYVSTVLISVRTDDFGAVDDRLVDIFQNNCVDTCGEVAHFVASGDKAGQCNGKQTVGDCSWNTDDHRTDGNGNIFFGADIGATPDVDGDTSKTHTVYAWVGSKDGDVFDVDDDEYVSVSAKWTPARDSVMASTSILKEAADGQDRTTPGAPADSGKLVNLGSTGSVVVTGQLVDTANMAVEQGGVKVRVSWTRYVFDRGSDGVGADDTFAITYENTDEAIKTTNDDGKVTLTVNAPRDIESDKDQDVVDEVTFTVDADGKTGETLNTTGSTTFNWVEDTRKYQKTTFVSKTEYVTVDGDGDDDDDANISVTVRLWDQYGDGIRVDENGNPYRITLTLPSDGHATDSDPDTAGIQSEAITKTPSISSSSSRRGMARALFAVNNIESSTHSLTISYQIADADVDSDGKLIDGDADTAGVQIRYANVEGEAASGNYMAYVYVDAKASDGDDKQVTVHKIFGDDAKKKIPATHFATEGSGSNHGVLYAMDNNDTYIKKGERAKPCKEDELRPAVGNTVRVVFYSTDSSKQSIFDITPTNQ